ncbi:AAA family ATPase [Schaalia sp. 19OD2882]|uniref:HelD family protein n=1 Tax=Schaalia sp. 19OD2882 TaxID=2794089 RepID=UPI001C1EDDFB|nr:AAA family ATPase [Schaalia sp. 19OD2882]QWW18951.1 AAA family ATPase [Schaalia sp. 19OD2882]
MSELVHPAHAGADSVSEQEFVDRAHARLDALRAEYRERQRATHASHGVGNAQGWTERDAIAAHLGEMAARLDHVEDRLVFGRLDMADTEVRYIGRASLPDEGGDPLLIDWRAPAAAPFYRATALDPQGVVRRRHLLTHGRQVVGLEDELLDASDKAGEHLDLQGEGALLAALGRAREGRMGDIVATIQAEQDRIIRADGDGLLVVQGGPGTGKTAVALHRAAYLLHARRERLERSGVLVVGPSRVFLRYIEKVLPSLGETGVVSLTVGDLVPGVRARGEEAVEVSRLKGRSAWVRLLARAVRTIVRIPEGDQVLQVWNRKVTLRREDVVRAVRKARRSGRPHNVAREAFALELMEVLATRLVVEAGDATSEAAVDGDDLSTWTQEVRDSIDARRTINLAWMPTSAMTLLERLWAKPGLLARLNDEVGSPFSRAELELLSRPRGSALTQADVPLLDELEELLGTTNVLEDQSARQRSRTHAAEVERAREAMESMNLGGGIVTAEMLARSATAADDLEPMSERAAKDRSWTYGHVVVDEAQDLGHMAWRALLRRCPSLSFTVVGDLDQARGESRPPSWKDALGPAARALAGEHVLSVSYRTPRTLTLLAEDVLARAGAPVLHPTTAVREVENCYRSLHVDGPGAPMAREKDPLWALAQEAVDRALARLDEAEGAGRGRIAVLVAGARAHAWDADTVGTSSLEDRVALLSATASKGLEFDSVVLVEPAEVLADGPGDLFVTLTRATHDLTVVHSRPLPAGMEEWSTE